MPLIPVLMIASVVAMLTSAIGAFALNKGPSTTWSSVMFAGTVMSYFAIGALVVKLYLTTGKMYPILALVPAGLTISALRAHKQSRASIARVE